MELDFSEKIHQILKYSREEALRLRNDYISTEHILLGLLKSKDENLVHKILINLKCDLDRIKMQLEKIIRPLPHFTVLEDVPLTKRAENVLRRAWVEAERYKSKDIEVEHLFLALLAEKHGIAANVLSTFNVNYKNVRSELEKLYINENSFEDKSIAKDVNALKIKKYGQDFTEMAMKGQIDPVIGRDQEIDRVIQILLRRKKNNPVLIGEPGVGKTAVVEGLALRIHERKVPHVFFDHKIINLDLGLLLAGTQFRGQFEERFKEIVDELEKYRNIIVFIDEIHTIIGAGGVGGNLDVSNLLKPALAAGKVCCIGATTSNEYQKYIERDKALERRFQKVMVEPPSCDSTYKILQGIKSNYESYHNVEYSEDALYESVRLADRYITDKFFPDKAIDLIDEAGAMISLKFNKRSSRKINEFDSIKLDEDIKQFFRRLESLNEEDDIVFQRTCNVAVKEHEEPSYEEVKEDLPVVTGQDIAKTVGLMTGIPVTRLTKTESERLLCLDEELKKTIIGQEYAIDLITRSIKRARAGLKDPKKPIGSFLFTGPSGCGKTKLAQELAASLFDRKNSLIQLDMSEFMEKFSVSRLIGAPPGYVGYEEGGQLTEQVRRHPYSVVLLDQIDKAHPEVLNILLQILDNGMVTDSLGRKVDFRNTLIIMTVNQTNSQGSAKRLGFQYHNENQMSSMDIMQNKESVKQKFPPEFINRLDEIVAFNPLTSDHFIYILEHEINQLVSKANEMEISITLTDSAKEYFKEKEFDASSGARSVRRVMQKYFENRLAEMILKKEIETGNKIYVHCIDDELLFSKIEQS